MRAKVLWYENPHRRYMSRLWVIATIEGQTVLGVSNTEGFDPKRRDDELVNSMCLDGILPDQLLPTLFRELRDRLQVVQLSYTIPKGVLKKLKQSMALNSL